MIDSSRTWQNWDRPRVAEKIEKTWKDQQLESLHRDYLTALLKQNIISREQHLLEVGCGTGLIYERIVPDLLPDASYVGVDVSRRMLDIAHKQFPSGDFRLGDGYDLDLPDRSFDLVICFEVLGHIPNIDEFVPNLIRVCRGTCLITIWPSPSGQIIEKQEFIEGYQFMHREYPVAYIRRLIRDAGVRKPASVATFPNGVVSLAADCTVPRP